MKKIFLALILSLVVVQFSHAQVSGYPNVLEDNLSEKPLWYNINIPVTLPGAIGVSGQAQYIKPNGIYGSIDVGISYVLNLSQSLVEEKNRNVKPIGSAEIGYALKIMTRSNKRRLLTGEYSSSGDQYSQKTYKISVPHQVLFIPVAGLSYDPVPVKVSNPANKTDGNKARYSVVLPSINVGVKLFGVNRLTTGLKDSKTGKVYKNKTQQLGGIYGGISLPMTDNLEVPNGYTSVLSSESPTWEIYGILPSYLNSSGTLSIGIKSVPYTRNSLLKPGSNTERESLSGGYQFYFGYHIYL